MRVLALTKIFPNRNNPNAMPYVPRQCAAMARHCDLKIWATVPSFPAGPLLRRFRSIKDGPSTVPHADRMFGLEIAHPRFLYFPRLPLLSGASYALSIAPRLLRHRHEFDVILATFAYPDGVAATALGQALGIPIVIQVIGSDIDVAAQLPALKPQVGWSFRHAAGVIAVSSSLAQACVRLGAQPQATAVIVTGVDRQVFVPQDRKAARRRLGLPADDKLILYVGRLSEEKGVLDALRAFERLQDDANVGVRVRLAYVGDGPLLQRLQQRAAQGGDVIVTGSVDSAGVSQWLAASDLLTLPSYHEGTPNVVLEALSSGRPVVATHVGGIPDICSAPLYGELVAPGSVAALVRAYERVLSAAHVPDQIAACPGLYDWDENARRVLEFLQMARSKKLRV